MAFFDVPDVLRALHEVVDEYGEDSLTPCRFHYTHQETGEHCVVGHILKKLGLELPDPLSRENRMHIIRLHYDFTADALSLLAHIQVNQDQNVLLGDILHDAYVRTEEYDE